MHAIDSAKRPEVQDDDAPAQLLDTDGVVAIDPVEAGREVGRPYIAAKLSCCHVLLYLSCLYRLACFCHHIISAERGVVDGVRAIRLCILSGSTNVIP